MVSALKDSGGLRRGLLGCGEIGCGVGRGFLGVYGSCGEALSFRRSGFQGFRLGV